MMRFKEWINDSQYDGKVLTLYHESNNPEAVLQQQKMVSRGKIYAVFFTFEPTDGTNIQAEVVMNKVYDRKANEPDPIHNPQKFFPQLIKEGYDGVVQPTGSMYAPGGFEVVVFNPHSIKKINSYMFDASGK
jgi:hypothetical protein